MEERFTEGWRAAGFVAEGIASDFGGNGASAEMVLEVTLHRRETVLRKFCPLDALESVVSAFCADFPRAAVQCHPDSAYGFVAQIKCQCIRSGSEGCCMGSGHDCATVTIVMSRETDASSDVVEAASSRFPARGKMPRLR